MAILGFNNFLPSKLTDYDALFRKGVRNYQTPSSIIALKKTTRLAAMEFIFSEDGSPPMTEFNTDRDYESVSLTSYRIDTKSYKTGLRAPRKMVWQARAAGDIDIFDEEVRNLGLSMSYDITKMMYDKLIDGVNQNGFDGVPFFSEDHPIKSGGTQSNFVPGGGPTWYMVSGNPNEKPIIYLEDFPPGLDPDADGTKWHHVNNDEYLVPFLASFGTGYGLPRFAGASNATPSIDAIIQLRNLLRLWVDGKGRRSGAPLSIILAPTELYFDFLQIVNASLINGGDTNMAKAYNLQVVEIPELDGV